MNYFFSKYTFGLDRLLHAKKDRQLAEALNQEKLAEIARVREEDNRWGMLFLLLVMLKEILEPVRLMVYHPKSWSSKIAHFGGLEVALPAWFLVCGVLLMPLIFLSFFAFDRKTRRTCIGLAALGLMGAAFAFGYMGLISARIDVPWLIEIWIFSAVACAFVMLLLASSVNNHQRIARILIEKHKKDLL